MSHIATVEVQIRDLDALDRACQRLGLELRRGQTTFKWWGNVGPRADMSVEQLTAAIRKYDKSFERPTIQSPEDWKSGRCLHSITMPGSEHGFEIGLIRSSDGHGFTLIGDLNMLSHDFSKVVGGSTCSKLVQTYSLEVARRQMQLKGFRVQELVRPNGQIQLVCCR